MELYELTFEDCKNLFWDSVTREEDEVRFISSNFIMTLKHNQDCCESVALIDIAGDLKDLENTRILLAECISSDVPSPPKDYDVDKDQLWTFYKLRTMKGDVTLSWFGTANGYYSIEVSCVWERRDQTEVNFIGDSKDA